MSHPCFVDLGWCPLSPPTTHPSVSRTLAPVESLCYLLVASSTHVIDMENVDCIISLSSTLSALGALCISRRSQAEYSVTACTSCEYKMSTSGLICTCCTCIWAVGRTSQLVPGVCWSLLVRGTHHNLGNDQRSPKAISAHSLQLTSSIRNTSSTPVP